MIDISTYGRNLELDESRIDAVCHIIAKAISSSKSLCCKIKNKVSLYKISTMKVMYDDIDDNSTTTANDGDDYNYNRNNNSIMIIIKDIMMMT